MSQLQNANEKKNNNLYNAVGEETMKQVAGGAITYPEDDPSYDEQFRFKVGAHAEYITGKGLFGSVFTDGCTIIHRGFNRFGQPCYLTQGVEVGYVEGCWIDEDRFE